MAPRITALCQFSYPGLGKLSGADTMMHSLMRYLVSKGWSGTAVAMGKPEMSVLVNGVHAHRSIQDYQKLKQYALGADVLITHLGATQVAKKIGKELGIPVVQLIHNTSSLTNAMLALGRDFVIYNSEWIQDHHKAGPSIVVRPPAELPQTFGGNPKGAITMVNLTANKGPDIFYALAAAWPEMDFLAVKGGYDVDKQILKKLDNVSISEFTDNLPELFKRTSVLVIPSKYESYSRVAVEAMSMGIPVIGSDTPGLKESLGSVVPRTFAAFNTKLRQVLWNYDAYSRAASKRYSFLVQQTGKDLELFESRMREISGTHNNLLSRSSSGL